MKTSQWQLTNYLNISILTFILNFSVAWISLKIMYRFERSANLLHFCPLQSAWLFPQWIWGYRLGRLWGFSQLVWPSQALPYQVLLNPANIPVWFIYFSLPSLSVFYLLLQDYIVRTKTCHPNMQVYFWYVCLHFYSFIWNWRLWNVFDKTP